MNRRRLLRRLGAGAALAHLLPASGLLQRAQAADLPALGHPVLVHLMCVGGPDFRHLLPPAYDSSPASYGHQFLRGRAAALGIPAAPAGFGAAWNERYLLAEGGGHAFGIQKGCTWLHDAWQQGHVAIVHNVVASTSRDHAHSQLVWESADRSLSQVGHALSGWGGRLADAADNALLSLTPTPRTFCYGRNLANPDLPGAQRIVTLTDPERVGLYQPAPGASGGAANISRALTQYYDGLAGQMPAASPYQLFVDHERQLRDLAARLRPLFASTTLPAPLAALLAGPAALQHAHLAAQFRALYFALAAHAEIDFHSISMAFNGFDTHDMQRDELEPRWRDLFGLGGALDALYQVLPPSVSERLLFMISGEFGRQLRANGDGGTDHGKGNSVLLIGHSVRGGHYGEPFPAAELDRLEEASPDIRGATDLDALLAQVLERLHPGVVRSVLPGIDGARTEPGVRLQDLFR